MHVLISFRVKGMQPSQVQYCHRIPGIVRSVRTKLKMQNTYKLMDALTAKMQAAH